MLSGFDDYLLNVVTASDKAKQDVKDGAPVIVFNFNIPMMTPDFFCAVTGMQKGVLRGNTDRGYVPTVKVGKNKMINMTLLNYNLMLGKAA